MSKHTPGPWRWELNLSTRRLQLCGGERPYDLTVMDFERWGMHSARPRLLQDGFLKEAEKFAEIVKGREHHASWFQTLNHPDACLIAAAPELLEACQVLLAALQECQPTPNHPDPMAIHDCIRIGEEAIRKATGGNL